MDDLILLVGTNPMPNYITAMLLKPKTVHLLYTTGESGTEDVADRLYTAMGKDMPGAKVCPHRLCSASEPVSIREDYERASVPAGSHLSFTGGTKAMSVFVYEAWKSTGGGQCSYLDGSRDELVFGGDEPPVPIRGVELTLPRITQLHGVRVRDPETGFRSSNPPKPEHAVAMLELALKDERRMSAIRENISRQAQSEWQRERSRWKLKDGRKELRLPEIAAQWNGKSVIVSRDEDEIHDWAAFLCGVWLEQLAAHYMLQSGAVETCVHSVNLQRSESRHFEVDVLGIKGHRTCVLSCSTCATPQKADVAKMKSFEVAVRGPQIGGDLTRTAFLGLIDPKTVARLERDHRAAWGTDDVKTKIFGRRHLQEWADDQFQSLLNWTR